MEITLHNGKKAIFVQKVLLNKENEAAIIKGYVEFMVLQPDSMC